jgi:hypothetical protein
MTQDERITALEAQTAYLAQRDKDQRLALSVMLTLVWNMRRHVGMDAPEPASERERWPICQ